VKFDCIVGKAKTRKSLIYKLCGYCGIVGLKKVHTGILFIMSYFMKGIITNIILVSYRGYSAQTHI